MRGKPILRNLMIGATIGLVILAGCNSTKGSRLRFSGSQKKKIPYSIPGVTAMDVPQIDTSWKQDLIQELETEKQDRDNQSDPSVEWRVPLR